MTDKQIIIDDVDVSGCLFHSLTTMGYAGYNYCKCFQCVCECHRDCNYKQLKRKEQEYEKLKDKLNKIEEHLETISYLAPVTTRVLKHAIRQIIEE